MIPTTLRESYPSVNDTVSSGFSLRVLRTGSSVVPRVPSRLYRADRATLHVAVTSIVSRTR